MFIFSESSSSAALSNECRAISESKVRLIKQGVLCVFHMSCKCVTTIKKPTRNTDTELKRKIPVRNMICELVHAVGHVSKQPPTCDVVGYPAVSGLTALAQTTVPLMQQADVVLRKTCPQVPGRNCHINNQTNSTVTWTPLTRNCGKFNNYRFCSHAQIHSFKSPIISLGSVSLPCCVASSWFGWQSPSHMLQ